MDPHVFALPWAVFVVWWVVRAGAAKKTVEEESRASRLAFVVPSVICGALLFARAPRWELCLWPSTLAVRVVGFVVSSAGIAFAIWAREHLGRNWSGTVTLKEDHELIRSGPYRLVRHPIYTGMLLGFVGVAVARGDLQGLVAVALGLFAMWRKSRVEERLMVRHFGDAYRAYQREVRALIPGIL